MARKMFNVRLEEAEIKAIDAAATASGENKSDFARRVLKGAVANWLRPDERTELDRVNADTNDRGELVKAPAKYDPAEIARLRESTGCSEFVATQIIDKNRRVQ